MVHALKTDREAFDAVRDGHKTFEIRKTDRDFQPRDELWLYETVNTGNEMAAGAPLEYTGRLIAVTVIYILRGPFYGLPDGWCIMSIKLT